MSYDFVGRRRGRWPARLMCRVLRASAGGSCGRRGRPRSSGAGRRDAPVVAIKAVPVEVEARCGGPRIHAERVARGVPRGASTAARPMREHGIAAETERESRRTTDSDHDRPLAGDVVARQFEPASADRVRTADITSIATGEGRPHLAAAEGLRSKRIAGRSMGPGIDSRPVVDAPEMAPAGRLPGEGPVAHPDRGGQYASEHHRGLLAEPGVARRMSRRANCWDNAAMGSFLASLKEELTHGEISATRDQARAESLEYMMYLTTVNDRANLVPPHFM